MSYNFSFADNGIYGAADINKITKRLVTSGVEDSFTDGVPYNLSAFNESGTLLHTSGVVPETVSTLKVEKAEGENTILINPGNAFFNDGSVIEIESGGHELSYILEAKNYVYLKNDLVTSNTSYPVCSPEAPSGDYVLLAEIEEDGTITDKRTYAKGKLPGYASNADCVMKVEDTIEVPANTNSVTITKTYNLGNNNFKYAMMLSDDGTCLLGLYNLETGLLRSFRGVSSGKGWHSREQMFLYYSSLEHAEANITYSGGTLSFEVHFADAGYTKAYVRHIPFSFYLF